MESVNAITGNVESVELTCRKSVHRLSQISISSTESMIVTIPSARLTSVTNELVERVADIIASYRIVTPVDKYETVMKPKMLLTVRRFIEAQQPITMVVPAFPFKSPNHQSKVMGSAPDIGERMTLQHINSIGQRIQQTYPPGGHVLIVSDGPCYNDLLGVSDKEVYAYGKGLQDICDRLRLHHIRFSDIFVLAGKGSPKTLMEYVKNVNQIKATIFEQYMPIGYDFDREIKSDHNSLSTYRGYLKFLESDLALYCKEKGMSKSAARKHHSKVARGMIERGKAFSALVKSASPPHIRLSIHASDNTDKLSIALLPGERYSAFPVTPWHNTPFIAPTETGLSIGRKPDVEGMPHKFCKDEYGLSFLRAKLPIFNIFGEEYMDRQQTWIEPLYPFGLRVQVPPTISMDEVNLDTIAELAKIHSPIIIEGLDESSFGSVSEEFTKLSDNTLSLSLLNSADTNGTVSRFVQVARTMTGPTTDAAKPDVNFTDHYVPQQRQPEDDNSFDSRYCFTHRWRRGSAVISDHSTTIPVHHSATAIRVVRAGG